ncbi:MAG: glycosyltransferase [Cyclobacteriaceae bacterium]|nr:glycosyltransferase [Cyclobacteriaceae bacterium]
MIEILCLVLVGIALLSDVLLLIFWLTNFKEDTDELNELPEIDILVAARNEEANIGRCLDSLIALDYPKNKTNIWVGDDDSTDRTWSIIERYQKEYAQVHGVQIKERVTKGNGKANVLAQLARLGAAEWLFVTDADIAVPKQWAKSMLGAAIANNLALVTGTSLVEGPNFISRFQCIEWLYATSMLKVVSDLGIQATTMGNNMAIRRVVYDEVGGYENIPFSVTEDLELFRQVKKRHETRNLFSANVLNMSSAQTSFSELIVQRKRWMRGAFQLPFPMLLILIVQAVFFPAAIALLIVNPVVGGIAWLTKWLTKYGFQRSAARKLRIKLSVVDSFIMDWVSVIFSMASLMYYLWPGKIKWKGRTY